MATLEPFNSPEDRERILRWAREKLRMPISDAGSAGTEAGLGAPGLPPGALLPASAVDIKTFVDQKDPKADTQLAATVAYFHRFVAPGNQRKETISKDDLVDACRTATRRRPSRPAQTLVNAYDAGYFDKAERGQYRLNSVGENLVAMVLPGGGTDTPHARKTTSKTTQRKSKKKRKGRSRSR